MKIPINKARSMAIKILASSGASDKEIGVMVDMICDQNYCKNRFSGFSKSEIGFYLKQLKNSIGKKSKIVVDRPSVKLINGNGKSACLIGMEMVGMVSTMAKKQGIGLVGLYNSTYHNIIGTYTRKIAESDLIGIVMVNGGPSSVVPYNGCQPIFGTNPISYAFPSEGLPIVFDGATAEFAYGSIRLARERGQQLKNNTYFDKDGKFTTDPNHAIGLIPFGSGYKGYAINLMIDIMTGILIRAKSGFKVKGESDLGGIFIAIDPSVFVSVKQFKKEVSQLVQDILRSKPFDKHNKISIPGYKAGGAKTEMISNGVIEIDKNDWDEFALMYNHLSDFVPKTSH